MVGRMGLVGDEAVVWDHYRGREDWRGHQDGVAVDLLHGKRRSDDLLLQRVSEDERRESSDPRVHVHVSIYRVYLHALRDSHVALGRLRGDVAGGDQSLHWLVEEHPAGH